MAARKGTTIFRKDMALMAWVVDACKYGSNREKLRKTRASSWRKKSHGYVVDRLVEAPRSGRRTDTVKGVLR